MNSSVWWEDKRIVAKPGFRWFRRRRPDADHALRIAIIPGKQAAVDSIYIPTTHTEPVDWLLNNTLHFAEATKVINLAPVMDISESTCRTAPRREINSGSSELANPTSGGDEGSSLADRLRILLEVPLELLLPGPT